MILTGKIEASEDVSIKQFPNFCPTQSNQVIHLPHLNTVFIKTDPKPFQKNLTIHLAKLLQHSNNQQYT